MTTDLISSVLVSRSEIVWLILDFSSNTDLYTEFGKFKISNRVFPEPCGGYSGMYKESYGYSPENAQKIMTWLESR